MSKKDITLPADPSIPPSRAVRLPRHLAALRDEHIVKALKESIPVEDIRKLYRVSLSYILELAATYGLTPTSVPSATVPYCPLWLQAIALLARGYTLEETAASLDCSQRTVLYAREWSAVVGLLPGPFPCHRRRKLRSRLLRELPPDSPPALTPPTRRPLPSPPRALSRDPQPKGEEE